MSRWEDTRGPDHQKIAPRDTPQAGRRERSVGDIWSNAAKCLDCGDVIRSINRHDFKSCSCGKLSVDGGSWYARRVFKGGAFENIIEMYDHIEDES